MAASLPSLPAELFDLITSPLSLPDLRHLRLVSQTISLKTTNTPRFKHACSHITVDLDLPSLQTLTTTLSHVSENGLHRFLKDLTVRGVLLLTHGLGRVERERTKPADPQDPRSLRRDVLGNRRPEARREASEAEVVEAERQWQVFYRRRGELEGQRADGQILKQLRELFGVLRSKCRNGGLGGLNLDVVVYREEGVPLSPVLGGSPWRVAWEMGRWVLETVVKAWEGIGMAVERLDVFTGTVVCAVQGCDVAALRDGVGGFGELMRGLKELKIRLSNRVLPPPDNERDHFFKQDQDGPTFFKRRKPWFSLGDTPTNAEERDAEQKLLLHQRRCADLVQDPRNYTGIADWLCELAPTLESLHLTFYHIENSIEVFAESHLSPFPTPPGRDLLSHLATSTTSFPKLRSLSLQNAHISAPDLQNLLPYHAPALESLDFREITLLTASPTCNWTTFFPSLSSAPRLSHLYLSNLFEASSTWHRRKVYIVLSRPVTHGFATEKERDPAFLWLTRVPGAQGRTALEFATRAEVLQGVEMDREEHYCVGCSQVSAWAEERRRLYGPPG